MLHAHGPATDAALIRATTPAAHRAAQCASGAAAAVAESRRRNVPLGFCRARFVGGVALRGHCPSTSSLVLGIFFLFLGRNRVRLSSYLYLQLTRVFCSLASCYYNCAYERADGRSCFCGTVVSPGQGMSGASCSLADLTDALAALPRRCAERSVSGRSDGVYSGRLHPLSNDD